VGGRSKSVPQSELKLEFLAAIGEGDTVPRALDRINRTRATYDRWRRADPVFANRVDSLRRAREGNSYGRVEIPFAEFSAQYLGTRVFPHMQNVVDLLEGNPPSWTPAGIVFEPG